MEFPDIEYIEVVYPSGEVAYLETGSAEWNVFSYENQDPNFYEYEDDAASLYIIFKLHRGPRGMEKWVLRVRVANPQVSLDFRLAGVSLRNDGNASYILANGDQMVLVRSGDFRAENKRETVFVASPVEPTPFANPEEEHLPVMDNGIDVGLHFEIDKEGETAALVWKFEGEDLQAVENSIVSIGFEISDKTLSGALTTGYLTDETAKGEDGRYAVDCSYENIGALTGTQASIFANLLKEGHTFDIRLSFSLNDGARVWSLPHEYTPVAPGTVEVDVENTAKRYITVNASWEGVKNIETLKNTYDELKVTLAGGDDVGYSQFFRLENLILREGTLSLPVLMTSFPKGSVIGEITLYGIRKDGKVDSVTYTSPLVS